MKIKTFLITLLMFSPLFPLQVDPNVQNESVFIGEKFIIQADIAPGKNNSATFIEKNEKVAILGIEKNSEENNRKISIALITLQSGDIDVPSIDLRIDNEQHVINGFTISSKNRTNENDTNIRDLKETVKFYEKDFTLLYLFSVLILTILLIFLAMWLKKRFKKEIPAIERLPQPIEVAEDFIKKANIARKDGDNESFVDLVTLGIKTYISMISKANYTEMTTMEVRKKLKKESLLSEFRDVILEVLNLGDRFKFADEQLLESELDSLIKGFEETVNKIEKKRVPGNDAS